METKAPHEDKIKKRLIRIMGVVLFMVGLLSAYFHWPMDHPWLMDLGGGLFSFMMITPRRPLWSSGGASLNDFKL